jgi:nitrogen fixation/metabolism regulation signal transduction histidine kinase
MTVSAFWLLTTGAFAATVGAWVASAIAARRMKHLAELVAELRVGDFDTLERVQDARLCSNAAVLDELRALGLALRLREREVAQREQLLRALVEGAPMAIVLLTSGGAILHANRAAQELFFEGQVPVEGNFLGLVERAPEALRRAVAGEGDELFSIDDDQQGHHVYQLAKRHFELDGQPVVLVVVNDLTRELHRQEADVFKRMIRIMAHELNNSLAPITSLIHSARIVSRGGANEDKLAVVFDTVAERAEHLRSFLDGFAQFARLPAPRKVDVDMLRFVERVRTLWPSLRVEGDIPDAEGWFDPAQIEQVLINLLKNADEAGGPPESVSLAVSCLEPGATRFVIRDHGLGMSPEAMKNALLPFYSTKEHGSGLGLPLCREIIEAHGGVLRLEGRAAGGLDVVVRLPSRGAVAMGKLTLTRS